MLNELREAIEAVEQARHGSERADMDEAARELTELVTALLDEPTNVQALALARLLRDFSDTESVSLSTHTLDLPEGYWSVALTSAYDTSTGNRRTFACGIAPDGSVSS